ncbi:hypothetical protein K438DRAFT_268362 [Mycena galopus ATCC 62051]|nr:hypothetical protein K438DRAFT_268362 [Mycena galopus ATCC 62051]
MIYRPSCGHLAKSLPCSSGGMNVANFTRPEHLMLGIGLRMGEFPGLTIVAAEQEELDCFDSLRCLPRRRHC